MDNKTLRKLIYLHSCNIIDFSQDTKEDPLEYKSILTHTYQDKSYYAWLDIGDTDTKDIDLLIDLEDKFDCDGIIALAMYRNGSYYLYEYRRNEEVYQKALEYVKLYYQENTNESN